MTPEEKKEFYSALASMGVWVNSTFDFNVKVEYDNRNNSDGLTSTLSEGGTARVNYDTTNYTTPINKRQECIEKIKEIKQDIHDTEEVIQLYYSMIEISKSHLDELVQELETEQDNLLEL